LEKKSKGISWRLGETLLAGIGQGYILTTPLQLAVMVARLVNGGRAVKPHLTDDIGKTIYSASRSSSSSDFENIGVYPPHLELVQKAMVAVANSPEGTAYGARISDKNFMMGGKTGTVQVRRISRAERLLGVKKNSELDWLQRDHAIFVGFAPIHAAQYAVSVVVEHGGGGSSVAAPIARDILLMAQHLDASRIL
jgi:penicillin-binding protein 2